MSHFLGRLTFFTRVVDRSADGPGITTREDPAARMVTASVGSAPLPAPWSAEAVRAND